MISRSEIFTRNSGRRASAVLGHTVLVALAIFALNASAQDTTFPAASSVLQPQAYVSLQPVPRGRSFEIAVVAKISPGVFLVETTYPRGVMRAFRFSKTPLRVYEGAFTVKMKLRANASAPLGPQKIGLTVAYQACNQDACLPPTKILVTAGLEIAAVDADARPAHPEVFSAAPAEH